VGFGFHSFQHGVRRRHSSNLNAYTLRPHDTSRIPSPIFGLFRRMRHKVEPIDTYPSPLKNSSSPEDALSFALPNFTDVNTNVPRRHETPSSVAAFRGRWHTHMLILSSERRGFTVTCTRLVAFEEGSQADSSIEVTLSFREVSKSVNSYTTDYFDPSTTSYLCCASRYMT